MRPILFLTLCACAALAAAVTASADPITLAVGQVSNNTTDVSAQLMIELRVDDDGKAEFKFWNDIGTASSITDIYFAEELGAILDFTTAVETESDGVAFTDGARPRDVNGDFNWTGTVAYTTDSDSPVFHNGINTATEYLLLAVGFQTEKDLTDLVGFFATTSLTGRGIGLHVQAVDEYGESDWYGVVPEPTSIALLGLGLAGLGGLRRRRRLV